VKRIDQIGFFEFVLVWFDLVYDGEDHADDGDEKMFGFIFVSGWRVG